MDSKEDIKKKPEIKAKKINRRDLIKSLIGIPVLGIFAFGFSGKKSHTRSNRSIIDKQLGLEGKIRHSGLSKLNPKSGDLIRVGLIGNGWRGKQLLHELGFIQPEKLSGKLLDEPLIQRLTGRKDLNIEIAGICDVFDKRIGEGVDMSKNHICAEYGHRDFPGAREYVSYLDMLDDKEIDAVIISTPDHWHGQMTVDAVAAGKHVYCEKPMTYDEHEAEQVYEAVSNSNIVFQLGHQGRQQESQIVAKELIEQDVLGKITLIDTNTNRNSDHGAWNRSIDREGNPQTIDWEKFLGTAPKRPFHTDRFFNWQKWYDYSTALAGNQFSHEFDAVNHMLHLGIPKTVMASGGNYYFHHDRDTPDVFSGIFEYPDRGITLTYSATLANSKERGRVIMGSDGYMDLGLGAVIFADKQSMKYKELLSNNIISQHEPVYEFYPGGVSTDAVSSATTSYYNRRGVVNTFIKGKRISTTYLHFMEWFDCIRKGGKTSGDVQTGFDEAVTCRMANVSYLERRRVEWDALNRKIT